MSEHTPGPWIVNRRGIMAMDEATGRFRAVVSQPNWRGVEPDDIWQDTANEANARLIAAAPDLLEALEALKKEYLTLINPVYNAKAERILSDVDASIAKAKGES